MRELFYDRCVHTGNTELLGQWDERNAPLTPKTVSYGSKKKLWWHCRKGHSWQAAVYNRSAGSGCPYCAGKAVESGGNDLASVYPELAKQWDAVKNAPLTPADVTPHTHRKVWWKCAQGHEWQASVHSRAQGTGCPICTNHIPVVGENTLADRFPQIAQEWDYEKNAPLTPEQVLPGTSRRVWWICPNGHSYRTNISSRTSGGNGCPICAGKAVLTGENDLQTKFPEIAAQWDWEKNTDCTPDSVAASSNRRVWWRCEQGHSFCTSILVPYFEKKVIPLAELKAIDIQAFYLKHLERVSARTVIHYHTLLHRALKYAVKIELIDANPVDKVDRPKAAPFVGSFYDSAEVQKLFEAAKGSKLEIPIFLGAFYGLRRSEAIGLKWDAIDFQNDTITIRHTVVSCYIDGKQVQKAQNITKTKSSMRTLPLIPAFKELLLHKQKQQNEFQRMCGKSYNKDYLGYICVDEMGRLLSPHYLTEAFAKLLKKHGLRKIRYHDLRHPYVKHTTKNISCKSRNPKPPTSGNLGFLFLLWFD